LTDLLSTLRSCAVFKLHRALRLAKSPVAHSERETPLPIPNRAVKPFSADGTWGATSWESRSPPVLRRKAAFGRLFAFRDPSALAYGRRTKGRSASRRRRLERAGVLLVRRRVSQLGDVLPTGSRPYSPRVAKSISRSTASVSRPVIFVVESNMSSYKVEGCSDVNGVLQAWLQCYPESAGKHLFQGMPRSYWRQ
jgi:hypothetical protein